MPDIKHLVVLMMENRSFDHLFGFRDSVNGLQSGNASLSNRLDPGQPESATNPACPVGTGAPYAIAFGQGPGHSLEATNTQLFDNPQATGTATNTGFVKSYYTELTQADRIPHPSTADLGVCMQSFDPSRLPAINTLASEFALCDNWYAEIPGPTQPNRLYLHAATSQGYALNAWSRYIGAKTIYQQIQEAGHTWSTYEHDSNEVRWFTGLQAFKQNFKPFTQFAADIQQGNLPNYAFIVPRMLADTAGNFVNSQHPPHDVRYGEQLIADVYAALRANDSVWNSCALVVIYDEHGGFYDHVTPPAASNPDGIDSPVPGSPSYAPSFNFDRLGLRVGAVIASPWIPKGTVVSKKLQHTSVMRTIRKLLGMPDTPLTRRDAEADDFADLFSLSAARTDAPPMLPLLALPTPPALTSLLHPANQPLDSLQQGILLGVHHNTQSSHPDGPPAEWLPRTQGEASAFIRARIATHFR